MRWRHPQRGMVSPADFIPLAEDSGLIRDISSIVLCQAIADCAAWRERGLPGNVAVNLSPRDCADPELARRIGSLLEEHGLQPRALTLEVTETALMQDPVTTGHLLEALDREGVAISVDDFGTGYSSLAYLKHLPIDEIKIDQVFVGSMRGDGSDAAIVRAIIGLAHSLDMRVVAEGVRDVETLSQLGHDRCNVAQGFLLAWPAPADELEVPGLEGIQPDWPPFLRLPATG